jgi:hypothetical protein
MDGFPGAKDLRSRLGAISGVVLVWKPAAGSAVLDKRVQRGGLYGSESGTIVAG